VTLVLTQVSKHGIAMAADSAVSDARGRALVGVQKLLPAYQVNGGLSVWGRGTVGDTPADEWLAVFIEREIAAGISLWQAGASLAEKLNDAFGGVIQQRMGVHVGGFEQVGAVRGPAFYHVHNGHYHVGIVAGKFQEIPDEDPPIREFRCHPDHLMVRSADQLPRLIRNGDFWVFSLLSEQVSRLLDDVKGATGFDFPYPADLATQGEYLRFWISTIKEIYRLSSARVRVLPQPATAGDASIGGPVTVLTISEVGIESFYAR